MKAAADWAAFMGTDVPSAAQQVGRALQSPTEGLRILERQLGKLTEAEEKHIESLAAQGRAVEAQRAVLDLLEKKIGGTAGIMNTGLLKSTTGVTKAWDDMLEAWGRTDAVGGRLNRMLGGLRDILKDIEGLTKPAKQTAQDRLSELDELITAAEREAGPGTGAGVEGGRGFLGDMPRQRQIAIARRDLEALKQQRRELIAQMQAFAGIEGFEGGLANTPVGAIQLGGDTSDKGKASAAAAAARDRAQVAAGYAASLQAQEDMLNEARELGVKFLQGQDKERIESAKRVTAAWIESAELATLAAEEMVYSWDAAGNRIEITREAFDALAEAERKALEVGKELSWAFVSGFEDAIIEGKKFRDVLEGIGKDAARIILRQTVTQPMANALSAALANMFGGGSTGTVGAPVMGGPGYAEGTDYVPRTGWAMLHQGERVIPAAENRGGAGGTYIIDARGADAAGMARLETLIMQLHGSIEHRAVAAVANVRARGTRLG
jgi:hypothetical protein